MYQNEYRGSFGEYSRLVIDLDATYGGPKYSKGKRIRGRQALLCIFEYLSTSSKSTCKEIAKNELVHSPTSKQKLKSVTDDIRKFIVHNLLPRKVVKLDGHKKEYNKKIQAYSLTHNGILYAIHLLSKNRSDSKIIMNIAQEYRDYFPFVFGKLDNFKKILGKKYLEYIRIHDISEKGLDIIGFSQDPVDLLHDFVSRSRTTLGDFFGNENTCGDMFTKLIYNNIFDHLYIHGVLKGYVPVDGEGNIGHKGKLENEIRQLVGDDYKLIKWYRKFVEEAISNSKKRTKNLMNFKNYILS